MTIFEELRQKCGWLPWLKDKTIILVMAGSHAYGTNTKDSDEDYRGVTIPPKEILLGYRDNFDQYISNSPDITIFGLHKFIDLAAKNNPNIIEILFTDNDNIIHIDYLGEKITDHRFEFLSTKCQHTFSGYAFQQLKRIKTHRRWLMNPPKRPPTREGYGVDNIDSVIPKDQLNSALEIIKKKTQDWELAVDNLGNADKIAVKNRVDNFLAELYATENTDDRVFLTAGKSIGFESNFLDLLHREYRFKSDLREWNQYQSWLKNRNSKRADDEKRFGYDGKHVMNLVRLMRMAKEMLRGDGVIVKRPDASDLMEIRDGKWSYDYLIKWASDSYVQVREAAKSSPLPSEPNEELINNICVEISEESLKE